MTTTQVAPSFPTVREVHLRDYWKIAWQGRWTVLAVFLLVVSAVAVWTFLKTPIYRATAVVEVQPQARRVGPGQDVSGLGVASYGWFAEERYQNTQIEIIRSRVIGEQAFRTLGLATHPAFQGLADPVRAFMGQVKVEPRRETGLIEISFEGSDRDEIARWANAVADAYVERNIGRARQNAASALAAITKLMDPLKQSLNAAQESQFEVLKDKEIYNPESQQEVSRQTLTRLNAEMQETRVRLGALRSLLEKVEEIQQAGGDPMSIPELAADTVLQDLNRQRVALEREVESAKVEFRPGHPVYQEKVSQLGKVQQRIRDQVALNLGKIRNDYDIADRRETYLRAQIANAEQLSYKVGVATSQYDLVKTDAQTRKQIYDVVTKTMNEIAVGADLLANNVSILDYANPPIAPIKPQKRLNLVMGSLIGLFLGLAAVFFLDYLDNTFRTPEDIETHLKLNTLAVVPRFAEEEAGSHAVREAFQSLRTGLIFLSRNRERKVVLVTSSGPQEGKSSTAAHLARTLAGAGDRVIVLDCDLRRPTQHVHLKLERENGLSNFLAAPKSVRDWTPFVKTVGPVNLHAMTCGPIPPNPPELLGSERFVALLGELREAYDWIVLDSPPAISLADAVLLSSHADMVLLVVQHNKADRDLVARSVLQFRNVGANLAGVILNNVDIARAYKKDYYYAGYYYYGSEGKKRRRRVSPPVSKDGSGAGAKPGSKVAG